jgi:membrane-bound metal-dependent hydrolase YbcI (DUF457 family)
MIFWHLGGTLAIARYTFRDPMMDVRFLFLGALLPDLIDKPLGRVFFRDSWDNGRTVAHSLVFAAVLLVTVMVVTRRGSSSRRKLMPLALGVILHLFLDFMWAAPETLWWPILGTEFAPAESGNIVDALIAGLTDPLVVAGEVLGLTYLIWMWRADGLSNLARRKAFLGSGILTVPIGRRRVASARQHAQSDDHQDHGE